MRALIRGLLIIATTLVTACAQQIPPLNYSPPNVGISKTKLDAEVKSITVSFAKPEEKTGDFAVGVGPHTTTLWRDSIQEALDKMVIFKDDAKKKISIAVKILKYDIPSAGASFTCNSAARYELLDRGNGDIIYTTDINAEGTVPFDYAFLGLTRAREALNRCAQNNIALFLQALETVDLSKPMFPATSAK
jgi:hypothetical protein